MKKQKLKNEFKNDKGIVLIALVAIIVLILSVAFSSIYYIFYKENPVRIEEFAQNNNTVTSEKKVQIRNVGMDTRIVNDMTEENVPIPKGFIFVQGNKDTGIIVKSNETGTEYLFIPYDESAGSANKEYYNKVDYISMDTLTYNAIKKYEGFFVTLNSKYKMDDLKTIDKKNYNKLSQKLKQLDNNKNIDSHMLFKDEIAQINSYLKKNNIKLGNNTIGIQAFTIEPFSEVNPNELTFMTSSETNSVVTKVSNEETEKVKNEFIYWYETSSKLYGGSNTKKVKVPIPSGFKWSEFEGTIAIQDESNENLIYIWVPLPIEKDKIDRDSLRDNVNIQFWEQVYSEYEKKHSQNFNENFKNLILKMSEESDKSYENSMTTYGGFFISEAELSNTYYKEYVNMPRGMKNWTVLETEEGGDYYRASNVKATTTNSKKIYNAMMEKAESSNSQKSVVAHLMYGMEYNAAITWIVSTNKDQIYKTKNGEKDIYQVICQDSTYVGKYEGSDYLDGNSDASEIKTFNCIWGLGGNLAELTQERYKEDGKTYYITRGGSYSDQGLDRNIASRFSYEKLVDENKGSANVGETIGMRTTLYINPYIPPENQGECKYFKYSKADEVKKVGDKEIVFEEFGNKPRYVKNADGTYLLKQISDDTDTISLSLAQKVIVTTKATSSVNINGSDMVLAKVKVEFADGKSYEGYVNSDDLTGTVVNYGDPSTEFVEIGGTAPRYYRAGLTVYKNPDNTKDKNVDFQTKDSGVLQITGKSVDQKWAIFKDGEQLKYVLAKQLMSGIENEEKDGITFFKENDISAESMQ